MSREALKDIAGVSEVYIFGSWAARREGKVGPAPNDVDVLVVGDVTTLDVAVALTPVSERTGLDVQPFVVTGSAWSEGSSEFVEDLKSKPLIRVLPISEEVNEAA